MRIQSSAPSKDEDSDLLPDTTDDESYIPETCRIRRSNRLAGVLLAEDPKPTASKSKSEATSGGASSDRNDLALLCRAMRAERDLARNEAVRERDHRVALEVENKDLKEELSREQAAHADTSAAFQAQKASWGGKPVGASISNAVKLLNKPAVFAGNDSSKTKVVDWLLSMKQWLTAAQADLVEFVTTAESYLREESMRYWTNRKKFITVEQSKDWKVFSDSLLERFDAENTPESARIRWTNCSKVASPWLSLCRSSTKLALTLMTYLIRT